MGKALTFDALLRAIWNSAQRARSDRGGRDA